ncbi:MAG: DUF429 domain-containing protein [Firmicutes bacterium]|nr:DUF429 domain-containing protein [Bacillota bacterium]
MYLQRNIEIKTKLKESHPEIGFLALSGKTTQHSKRKKEGFKERKEIFCSIYPKSNEIIEWTLKRYLRKEVQRDDILDALCLALNAAIGSEIGFKTVPQIEEVDKKGLGMSITIAKRKHI